MGFFFVIWISFTVSFVIWISFTFSKAFGVTRWVYQSSFGFPSRFVSVGGIVGGVTLRHSGFLRFSKPYGDTRWGYPSSFEFPSLF